MTLPSTYATGQLTALQLLGLTKFAAEPKTYKKLHSLKKKLEPGDILLMSMAPQQHTSFTSDPLKYTIETLYRKLSPILQGDYTHSAMYVGKDKVVELRAPDITRERSLRDATKHLEVMALRPDVPKPVKQKAVTKIKKHVGKGYSYEQLLQTGLKELLDVTPSLGAKDSQKFICSNLISDAYKGVDFLKNKPANVLMPADFAKSPLTKTVAKLKTHNA
jgi:uncharacterized protein YycO